MKSLTKNKGILAAVVIFVLVMALYNMFKTDLIPVMSPPENIGSDIVEMFVNLEKVNLQSEVLSSPMYKNLSDFSVVLSPQPTGRTNPFSIIGQD